MMPGETILSGAPIPVGFQKFEICRSAAGYYVGYIDADGPYCRETQYTQDVEEASRWMRLLNEAVVDGRLTSDEDVLNRVAFLPFVRQ